MGHETCCLVVLLAKLFDGIGTFQRVDGLIIVRQERRVEVGMLIHSLRSGAGILSMA